MQKAAVLRLIKQTKRAKRRSLDACGAERDDVKRFNENESIYAIPLLTAGPRLRPRDGVEFIS